MEGKQTEREGNNLHNPIPVVPGRHPEEREESHAKVVEGSVATETLTRVLIRTLWKRMKKRRRALEVVSVCERKSRGEEEGEVCAH